MRPIHAAHPFLAQRRLWCRLEVHFNGVDLCFAMPSELDHFLGVMEQNPLPSGHRLHPGSRLGRPMRHWLAKLPAKSKPTRFRKPLCGFLRTDRQVQEFRDFYQSEPVRFDFPDVYDSFQTAQRATFSR
ncbi:MAG: hypothetical protein ACPGUX_09230 [Halocynthiibacter sp.]